jgi:hypothetical protein
MRGISGDDICSNLENASVDLERREHALGVGHCAIGVAEHVGEKAGGMQEHLRLVLRREQLDSPILRQVLVRERELGERIVALRRGVQLLPQLRIGLAFRRLRDEHLQHCLRVFEPQLEHRVDFVDSQSPSHRPILLIRGYLNPTRSTPKQKCFRSFKALSSPAPRTRLAGRPTRLLRSRHVRDRRAWSGAE